MATIRKRFFSVVQIDTTFYICLPREYATAQKIHKRDIMESTFSDSGILVYRHIKNLDKATIEKEIADAKREVEALP